MADVRRDKVMVSINTSFWATADCVECVSADPDIRARHHLGLAKQGGLDVLRPHLYQHYAQFPRITSEERRDAIESLCNWVGGMMTMWGGFADEETGAPLPWWEARRQAMDRRDAIAAQAYERAPEGYKTKPGK